MQNLNAANVNLASYAYGYDTRDVRTGVTSQMGSDPLKQIAYAYDAVDQLTGESASGGVAGTAYSNAFQYDSMGNRTRAENVADGNTHVTTSTANTLNQLTALSHRINGGAAQNSGLSYDASGNLTQAIGSDGGKVLYSYDDADRLVKIENRSAANAPVSKSEFVYDYASRKAISREFSYTAGAWVKTGETKRVFDGLDVIQERNDQNEATAQYTRDGNIGGILARASASGKSYFHYDGGGNVTALSDETGNIVGRYSYDAFGNTLEASGPRAAENPYRFSTKEWHAASGMVDFGFRFYSPGMGRWLNRDPIQEDGGVNLYAMVENDPVNRIDEWGMKPRTGGALGGWVQNEGRYPVEAIFDTGSGRNRIIWRITIPRGYENNPGVADVDYVRNYGDSGILWYHLKPWGVFGAANYWTTCRGNTTIFASGARPVYRTPRGGTLGALDRRLDRVAGGQFSPGEWIDRASGLPHKMVGNPPSRVVFLTGAQAQRRGFIRPIRYRTRSEVTAP